MDMSLYKKMGVHDGKMLNAHLFNNNPYIQKESDRNKSKSDKGGTIKDEPNVTYYSKGGEIRKKRLSDKAFAKSKKDKY